MAVIDDPDVDIVCELIGGLEPAGSLILAAFDREKPVVTANKELLATRGRELFDASDAKGLDLYFEAAVGGGIPLIRPLKESLTGERLRRVMGIVNGTTNFILTKMSDEGRAFEDVLAEAQRLGYAEADPTADVGGHDAAAKCAILASIAFNARVVGDDVYREGISTASPPRTSSSRAGSATREAPRDRRDGRGRADRRPGPSGDDPCRASARERARRLQRRVRRRPEGRRADVLRPRRGRRPDGDRGRSATSSRSRGTWSPRPAGSGARASANGRSARWTR